ncbi:hypothetical protein [Ruminococcus gauvreauii]|uniref:Uncharacterized protein n=1 Tax=Ruminococcus gauvreauii TaxID=438033 RepID=A0ABY5VHW2_9FIRM|nr:hypothetical protein [Ruminococcus gauvreauii]UWP60150.1 hypothetical protein NQ502_03585 [Ruminococcus gauvreauii]
MMEKQDKLPELLEYVAERVGCTYLSDLHQPQELPCIQQVIRKMEPQLYDIREWKNAVQYITGESMEFETPEQAAGYLQDYLPPGFTD